MKCFLHISYDEQRERLLARLDDPDKHWKFNDGDIDERARWDDYQAAYEDALERCTHRGGALVRGPRRPQVVPELGGREPVGRDPRGDGSHLPTSGSRHRGAQDAARPSPLTRPTA